MAKRSEQVVKKPSGPWQDRVLDVVMRTVIGIAKALPYKVRVPVFGALVGSVAMSLSRFRKRIENNLSYIFPEMSDRARRATARASANGVGRLLIENYSGTALASRMASVVPTGPGLSDLAKARDAHRPVILLSGHFGNYEAARSCLIAQGYRIGGLYRPLSNAYFNAHYVATMETIGGPVFPQGREGMKGLLTFLKKGGMAMMLNDVYVGTGTQLPFVGQPAMTSTSAAEIALRLGAALIPVYGIRQLDGVSFAVEVEAEIPHSDPVTMTRAYNASIEARIRAHPEQWFWVHRRWKVRSNKADGGQKDLHPAALPSRLSRL